MPVIPVQFHSTVPVSIQFLSKKLGASPVIFGYMQTVFAVSMLVGGPIFGRFGDLFGARAALVVAFLSSFLSYGVLAIADSISMLFLSKIFGFMMHAMHGGCDLFWPAPPLSHMSHSRVSIPGAQMVMTDVSGSTERADALGRLGVSYGVGMVVGEEGSHTHAILGARLYTEERMLMRGHKEWLAIGGLVWGVPTVNTLCAY